MSLVPIVVWELPNCVQCHQTKREFDRRGIIYKIKRLDKSAKAVERFKELGLLQAPIIETDTKRWSGFRLEKIKSLEQHLKTERMHGINVPLEPIRQVADEVGEDD
jgi:glutaredoxin-like protein NrdH